MCEGEVEGERGVYLSVCVCVCVCVCTMMVLAHQSNKQ